MRCLPGNVTTFQHDVSGRGLDQAHDALHQGGLTHPVAAQKSQNPTLFQFEVDAVYDLCRSIPGYEIGYRQNAHIFPK